MLFQDEVPEDKGLFTFYRQQAERQDEIKREKKLRKKQKVLEVESQPIQPPPCSELPSAKNISLTKHYLMPKTINANAAREPHPSSKPRVNLPKQRLVEAIVDMGNHIEGESQLPINALRHRDSSHILKTRRYPRSNDQAEEPQQTQMQQVDEMRIQSLHRRNQSEELHSFRANNVIHSGRGSVELPQIRKPDDLRPPFRPKKSLKSKLVQDALTSRDRDKIRQIRNYLKAQAQQSPLHLQDEAEMVMEERGIEVFQFRQQKLLGILKRFRKS